MRLPFRTTLLVVVLCHWAGQARAEDLRLTLPEALELARRRAPTVLSTRYRIEEARGRLTGASVFLRDNPVVEAAAGSRSSGRGDVEAVLGVSQLFELGGRRAARIEGAQAGVARTSSESDDRVRRLLRAVSLSFLESLHAQEEVRLATATEGIASELLRAATLRHQA